MCHKMKNSDNYPYERNIVKKLKMFQTKSSLLIMVWELKKLRSNGKTQWIIKNLFLGVRKDVNVSDCLKSFDLLTEIS